MKRETSLADVESGHGVEMVRCGLSGLLGLPCGKASALLWEEQQELAGSFQVCLLGGAPRQEHGGLWACLLVFMPGAPSDPAHHPDHHFPFLVHSSLISEETSAPGCILLHTTLQV